MRNFSWFQTAEIEMFICCKTKIQAHKQQIAGAYHQKTSQQQFLGGQIGHLFGNKVFSTTMHQQIDSIEKIRTLGWRKAARSIKQSESKACISIPICGLRLIILACWFLELKNGASFIGMHRTVLFVTHVHHSQLKNIAVVSNMRLPIEIVPSLTYDYFTASLNSAIHLKIVPFLLCITVQMQLTFFFGTALAQLPVEISQWEENSDGFFISLDK